MEYIKRLKDRKADMKRFFYYKDDPGFCRVYYRGIKPRSLYCIQEDGSWVASYLSFYVCSSDGEPSYAIDMPEEDAFDKYIIPSKRP